MAENLPLLPDKRGVCADVSPVLQEVFRDVDYLPPLGLDQRRASPSGEDGDGHTAPHPTHWIEKYKSDCKEIWRREGELKSKYAERISRHPLPNIYKQYPPRGKLGTPSWKEEHTILNRSDLVPTLVQNSRVEDTLWVKNILTRSSCDVSVVERGPKVARDVVLHSPREESLQSISFGEVASHHVAAVTPHHAEPVRAREHILCIPPHLDFINFTVGRLHTKKLRIVNTLKCEVRLSVRPPAARQLDVEMVGARGLTVTSGAAAEFKIHFRPSDVLTLRDELLVRVSTGTCIRVPISCYMQPPLLHIVVSAITSPALFSCSPGSGETVTPRNNDCLELGAKLLGDTHCVSILFNCESEHAAFFLLTEEAWLSYTLDMVSDGGWVVAPPFAMSPARWAGGGAVRGRARCRAARAGPHAAPLRLLCSTAVVRPLTLLADALHFTTEHITIQAQDKDYDICSDDDPACQYYVHLGTAFPKQALSATVQVINHSPVTYSYYWTVRPWGVCSCGEAEHAPLPSGGDAEGPSSDTQENKNETNDNVRELTKRTSYIRVDPARGTLPPRASCCVHVRAADVGTELGIQRAVLMLILKNIPKESFRPDYDPMIVKTEIVDSDQLPGEKVLALLRNHSLSTFLSAQSGTREVCEVVCAQVEVWWEVAPVRFMLDPPLIHLTHSRRVSSVELKMRATQVSGREGIRCRWQVPEHAPAPPPVTLSAAHSRDHTLEYPLLELPDAAPDTQLITLKSACGSWQSQCVITRRSAPRPAVLRPPWLWLGVLPPGSQLDAQFEVINNTFQHIDWCAEVLPWHGAGQAGASCAAHAAGASCGTRAACDTCRVRACACAALRPPRDALRHGAGASLVYSTRAPQSDGCMVTLIAVRRTDAGKPGGADGSGGAGGGVSVLACRVLAPRLVLRVLPCKEEGCAIDGGGGPSARGCAVLRPAAALVVSRRACYTLRFTNITPLATSVTWGPPLEEDDLKVVFIPNDFNVGSYAQVETQVVLEGRRVRRRRVYVYQATVEHAHQPLYLVIDAAISGLEITCEVPLGGGENTNSTMIIRRTQGESSPSDVDRVTPLTPEEIFRIEDRKRATVAENICRCKNKLVYMEPTKRPRPPLHEGEEPPPVDIVWEPPPKTRVCPCCGSIKPVVQEPEESYCLQFQQLPLRTEHSIDDDGGLLSVRSRTVIISNESMVPATWTAAVRRWPRMQHKRTLSDDAWSSEVGEPGVALQCWPAGGTLGARARARLRVRVYADCWGLYRDQILIQIESLEAIVLDVWVEAVGTPLHTLLRPAPPLYWTSATDPERTLLLKNESRADLVVHAYTLTDHARVQDSLPFRVYMRLHAAPRAPPPLCPCVSASDHHSHDEVQGEATDSLASPRDGDDDDDDDDDDEMTTAVELYLAPDHGVQDDTFYKVAPESRSMAAGARLPWRVSASGASDPAPAGAVLLRAVPARAAGAGWCRGEPPALVARLRRAERSPRLQLSCRELRVHVCALDVPLDDVIRIRKHFHVKNVGNGALSVNLKTAEPWSVGLGAGGAGCACGGEARGEELPLTLPPRSSLEVYVEVCVHPADACPPPPAAPSPPTTPTPAPPPAAPSPPATPTPAPPPAAPAPPALPYDEWRRTTTELIFYDNDSVLKTLPLTLELEFPRVSITPEVLDLGCVTDGRSRNCYFSVAHSSRTAMLALRTECRGAGLRARPAALALRPRCTATVHLHYTPAWSGAPAEGRVRVVTSRAWCGAQARVRVLTSRAVCGARDGARSVSHDSTGDVPLSSDAGPPVLSRAYIE